MNVSIGEVKELYVVIFSRATLFHIEKQRRMDIEKPFYWGGDGGKGK